MKNENAAQQIQGSAPVAIQVYAEEYFFRKAGQWDLIGKSRQIQGKTADGYTRVCRGSLDEVKNAKP